MTAAAQTFVLFCDVQKNILPNGKTVPAKALKRAITALAKLVKLHALPFAVTAVPQGGDTAAWLLDELGDPTPRVRNETTAFADRELVSTITGSGRPVLLLAGVASEIVVQRTALDALAAGLQVQVAVDACGGIDARTEEAVWRRITGAGGVLTSVVTFTAELAGDMREEPGSSTRDILYELIRG